MKEELTDIFKIIDSKLEKLSSETGFSLPDLYDEDQWRKIYIGDRVMAGNLFLRKVNQGFYNDIQVLPKKDRKNRTLYFKS
ncbi:single-stranded DNA-binding protein [Oenococcus oeni]|uniref:single-stranded DNA-binding protein n=1 Tax=Oenococcus oeni TaxID=1247 RepID=UPI00050E46BF|nr:single-stranded DNA-binding protein [Oenococcus oeni]KGI02301.1 hypothetical protein X293_02395 [Oenococcus oeni IOEB_C52]SYW16079.1 conserved hypothetical protein [Oenococcus oeni]